MNSKKKHWRYLLTLACTVVLCAARPGSGLVISEVMYHPAGAQETLEFVELYNNRAVVEDLSGCAFTNGIRYIFEPGTFIGAGQYLVVAKDPAAVEAAYGIDGVLGPYDGRLDNDGERIELSGYGGKIMLSFRYADERPWPVSPDGAGHSLVLSRLGGDPEEASSWSPSTFIGGTPGRADSVQAGPTDPSLITLVDIGHPGSYFKGTQEPSPGPTGQATTAWTQIEFNDNPVRTAWSEGPSGYGYSNDPGELQFIRTQLNDMNGHYMSVYARLRFDLTAEQIRSFTQLFAEVHYDDGYVLYLNGTRVGASEQIAGNPPPFNQSGGTATDPPIANVDLTSRMNLLVAGTNILAIQAHNASLSGSSDCFGSPILKAIIGGPGDTADTDARVVINELLANSDENTGADRIELYNPGPSAIDLSNVYLSDDRTNLLKYKIPDGTILGSGEFLAISQGVSPDEFEFGLDFTGETVYVTAATNGTTPSPVRVLDAVRYEAMPPEMTFGRFPNGSNRFAFLSSATFGGPNAQPLINDVVINEIMYHHATRDERYEYVELYNKGNDVVSLNGWSFTDGIDYTFGAGAEIGPGEYLVVARDPEFLEGVYSNLVLGSNLFGPYSGSLDDHSERIRLSYPLIEVDPDTGVSETYMVPADEVTYYDGGRWSSWADGQGSSLELRDPRSDNDTPGAWADSDESGKTAWEPFSFTIDNSDSSYTHDQINVFDVLLLNRGEVLLDDLEVTMFRANGLNNGGFENGETSWRMLGNHIRSYVTTEDCHSGSRSLHLISTGHGDPGANRVNQSIRSATAGSVTFAGWARWIKGSRYLLLRTSRERAPVQPPRPAHAFELTMPMNLGTPGIQNTAFVPNRGPDILEVQHAPVLPASGEPIVVTARVFDNDGVEMVSLNYRTDGSPRFTITAMVDNGWGDDMVAGDGIFTATIPGASGGTMRAFYIEASDGRELTRFPAGPGPTANVPDRTCLVRVGDSRPNTRFATYRIWLSNDVRNAFRSRPNLSNELMDCTFVYNDSEIFYNAAIRYRGSPFLRSGSGRDPLGRYAYRLDFNPDQKLRGREEINLDNTEDGNRGPLQERASYWFYKQMGLQHSAQEFVRPIINGTNNGIYEDVQKIDGDYIDKWFGGDTDGYIHKIDDYFEYSADGTGYANLDEGLKYDSRHPLLKETYRWGFEKRSHRENDAWDHLFDFAVAMNTPSSGSTYEKMIESVVHPEHLARVLAVRHAVGDWDSYGYSRGKNNYFYYALPEGKWYLLPWDIDFTLGSGNSPGTSLFSVNSGQFPEVDQFLRYPKYRRMYLQAFAELVNGPWQTSFGTNNPPTAFDEFLDDAANALIADGLGNGRRDGIKQFVRDRRAYILTQIPSLVFEITTNSGRDFFTSASTVSIQGVAPIEVAAIAVNGMVVPSEFSGNNTFEVNAAVESGPNLLNLQGLNGVGNAVPGAADSITVTRIQPSEISSVTPNPVYNGGTVQLTIHGNGFSPGSSTQVALTRASKEIGFDALYVKSAQAFDRIDAATLLLDDPTRGVGDEVHAVHRSLNLWNSGGHGVFTRGEDGFAMPFNSNADNFAVRFSGYISATAGGRRYFGVNSDDGFSLRIDGQLVGEYANPRSPATTDVVSGRTAGTMTFDFSDTGRYYLVLDYYENGGGEEIEFFQTNSAGSDQRLINVDSELTVFRDDAENIAATNVVVLDAGTITCRVDLTNAQPGAWNVVVTPPYGEGAQSSLDNGLQIISR